jgi:hypothetical protein
MMSYLHPILTITAVVTPFIAVIMMARYKESTHWIIWLLGSAVFGWILLILGDSAYYSDLISQYGRTKDPELLKQITGDSGSGMLKALGIVATLIWSSTVFGLMVVITHTYRRISRRLKIT